MRMARRVIAIATLSMVISGVGASAVVATQPAAAHLGMFDLGVSTPSDLQRPRSHPSKAPTATPSPEPTPTTPPVDPIRAAEYWLEDYGIRDAWKITRGAGVRIAVIDTGISRGSPELSSAVVAGTDVSGIGNADGSLPLGAVDANHGSWVASLAAARGTGSGTGMIGVAPEADLLSVSVAFGAGSGIPFTEQIAKGIYWAVDNGAKVINLSLTTNTSDWDKSWDDAFLYAFENDVVVVVAAGNRGSGTERVGAPATIPGVLTVAGVDPFGVASYEASTQGITIGVAAPSENLIGVSADGRVQMWSGTSGATPIAAGIVALVRAAHPELDAANVINRIIRTARPPADTASLPDPIYGYGLVDALAAVTADVEMVTENPMGSLAEWIKVYRRAEVAPVPQASTGPVIIERLPPADTASAPGSAFLPSEQTLLYATLPLALITATAILVALGVNVAVRRIRMAFRTPSR